MLHVYAPESLHHRLQVFVDAGLVCRIPSPWQIRQGVIEMTPYVISTDATAEEGYEGAPFGHPLLRQPLIFSQIGFDHLRTGSGLDVRLSSLCTHLQLTYHRGMPVFDLQAVQTHDEGLDRLRASIEEVRAGRSSLGRRRHRLASLILGRPDDYFERFLGEQGWIARAARFDYATPADAGSDFPPEFFSLVGFLNHCASAFPVGPRSIPAHRLPGHLVALATRRFREGRGFGWFTVRPRSARA